MARAVTCDTCHGAGKVAETPCEICGGNGRTPASACARSRSGRDRSGQRLRVQGAGHAGEPGAPAGDLYVEVIDVTPDERFQRDGTDLITVVSIPATEAMLGTSDRADPGGRGGDRARRRHPAWPRELLRGVGLPQLGGRVARQPARRRRGDRPDQPHARSSARPAERLDGTRRARQPRAPTRRGPVQPRPPRLFGRPTARGPLLA